MSALARHGSLPTCRVAPPPSTATGRQPLNVSGRLPLLLSSHSMTTPPSWGMSRAVANAGPACQWRANAAWCGGAAAVLGYHSPFTLTGEGGERTGLLVGERL